MHLNGKTSYFHHLDFRKHQGVNDNILRIMLKHFHIFLAYKDRYEHKPILVISTGGDEFFMIDDSRFYYDEMVGPTYLRYTNVISFLKYKFSFSVNYRYYQTNIYIKVVLCTKICPMVLSLPLQIYTLNIH